MTDETSQEPAAAALEAPTPVADAAEVKPRRRRKAAEPEQVGSAVDQVVNDTLAQSEERKPLPDPRGIHVIALTGDNEGPHMRLLRSHRYKRMEMQFDENPGEEVRDALKDKGWSWRNQDKIWVLPLDREAPYVGHMAAEKLFRDVANTIRQNNGLPEVGGMAAAV